MLKVGITGQGGFIGWHLFNTLGLYPDEIERIAFDRTYFENPALMDAFVSSCDVIVHLAALNRHNDPAVIYETNLHLVKQLIASLERTGNSAHVIMSSSTQEEKDNQYGRSKKEGRELLADWAKNSTGVFTGLVIPNVFGPFGHPFYNSVVATFCHKLTHDQLPVIDVDGELNLVHVGELVQMILEKIRTKADQPLVVLPHSATIKVSGILALLNAYQEQYLKSGIIPHFNDRFELNLFNTFRSFIDLKQFFPVKYTQHTDNRGSFVELIRLNTGGQVSFSTTHPGITRGNHFHTRKIERFSVIRGEALIQLRKIGTNETIDFHLSGKEPAFVDMPVWYTHNIKNIGTEELYTIFWINEFYDANDPDTFFETV